MIFISCSKNPAAEWLVVRIFAGCATALLVMFISGCSGTDGPTLVPVFGTVTVKGSEPFAEGLVRFIPAPNSGLNSREATTDSEGNYTIMFQSDKPGLQPGSYKVMFSMYKMPDGSEVPDQTGDPDPKHPTALGAVQYVPVEYEFGRAPECAVTVSAETSKFDFDLPALEPQTAKQSR